MNKFDVISSYVNQSFADHEYTVNGTYYALVQTGTRLQQQDATGASETVEPGWYLYTETLNDGHRSVRHLPGDPERSVDEVLAPVPGSLWVLHFGDDTEQGVPAVFTEKGYKTNNGDTFAADDPKITAEYRLYWPPVGGVYS